MKSVFRIVLCMLIIFMTSVTAFADMCVPILLYHCVVEELAGEDDPRMIVTADRFSEHMQALKDHGYDTITYDQYMDYVKKGTPLPPKPIIINFDDGYENNYTYAYPILRDMNMKATIFIVAGYVGATTTKYPHFTWEQALEMEHSGVIDIQSHTMTHPMLSELSYEETLREMRMSKYLVEKNMGKECKYMAYPFGVHNEWTDNLGVAAGYELMCVVGDNGANGKDSDLYAIRRLTVSQDMDADSFIKYIEENTGM